MAISKKRYPLIDILRVFAIFLMLFFHLFYDLNYFDYYEMDYHPYTFWFVLPRIIVFLFLTCVGASLYIVHYPQKSWVKWKKRLVKLGIIAAIISVATYFIFPSSWVYFGIIHCIFFATLVGIFLVSYPKFALIIAILIWTIRFGFNVNFDLLPWFSDIKSIDDIPLYPWIATVFFGIFFGTTKIAKIQFDYPFKRKIEWISKNSLIIYLLHQPIIFGVILGIYWILTR